jgi:hypothetical protein
VTITGTSSRFTNGAATVGATVGATASAVTTGFGANIGVGTDTGAAIGTIGANTATGSVAAIGVTFGSNTATGFVATIEVTFGATAIGVTTTIGLGGTALTRTGARFSRLVVAGAVVVDVVVDPFPVPTAYGEPLLEAELAIATGLNADACEEDCCGAFDPPIGVSC